MNPVRVTVSLSSTVALSSAVAEQTEVNVAGGSLRFGDKRRWGPHIRRRAEAAVSSSEQTHTHTR